MSEIKKFTPPGMEVKALPDYRRSNLGPGTRVKDELGRELPGTYSTIDEAFKLTVQAGSTVYFQGAEMTAPPEVLKGFVNRCEEIAKQQGIIGEPVVEAISGVHTEQKYKIVRKGQKGPIHLRPLFTGADVRQEVQEGIAAEPLRRPDGTITRLEDVPSLIFSDSQIPGEFNPDVIIVQATPANEDGFRNIGSSVDVNGHLIDKRRLARRTGNKPAKLIVVENKYVTRFKGDGNMHYLEADYVVKHDSPMPVHPEAAPTREQIEVAGNLADGVNELLETKYPEFDFDMQAGIGPAGLAVEKVAKKAKKRGRKVGMYSEVVGGDYAAPLADEGILEEPIVGTFSLRASADAALHPDRYHLLETGKVNNVKAIRQRLEQNGNRKFVAINWTILLALNGNGIAAEAKKKDGWKVHAGHGGQGVMMKAATELGGIAAIGLQAKRLDKDGNSISSIVLSEDGAEVTTPANNISLYATEFGYHIRQPLTGNPEKDRVIKKANVLGLISIAAPEFRESLTREARIKGLLPEETIYNKTEVSQTPATIFDIYNPARNPFLRAGFDMYNNWLKVLTPPAHQTAA